MRYQRDVSGDGWNFELIFTTDHKGHTTIDKGDIIYVLTEATRKAEEVMPPPVNPGNCLNCRRKIEITEQNGGICQKCKEKTVTERYE